MALSERLFAAGLEQLSGTVVQIRNDAKSRLDLLEQKFSGAEEAAQFNTNALNHALERMEILASQRALDQTQNQRRATQVEQRCDGQDESLARLETAISDADFSRRLDTLEDKIDDTAARLNRDESRARISASLQAVMSRLETLEQGQAKLQEDVRARMFGPAEPFSGEPMPAAEVPDFAPPPASFFWSPTETHADSRDHSIRAEPSFDEVFVQGGREEAFAPERHTARVDPRKSEGRYIVPIAGALLLVAVLAGGLLLSENAKEPVATRTAGAMQTYSLPEPANSDSDTVFVVAPQADSQPGGKNTLTPPSERGGPSRDRMLELANSGNVTAMTILGLRALDDTGAAPVNLLDAVRFLTQAAEKGQPVAQFRLGSMYEHAQGVATDLNKAAHWYEMAAGQGNRKAMHNLAVFYATGALGRKNLREAARWFEKAAILGLRDSQFNLAYLHERGGDVPQDLQSAYKWYAIAAAGGDRESKVRVLILQDRLSAADRAAAKKAVAGFYATPLNRGANVNPVADNL
jgi:Sel1 repeat